MNLKTAFSVESGFENDENWINDAYVKCFQGAHRYEIIHAAFGLYGTCVPPMLYDVHLGHSSFDLTSLSRVLDVRARLACSPGLSH